MLLPNKRVFIGDYVFTIPKEVYEPGEDTLLLVRNLSRLQDGLAVLDMGTGCGVFAILVAESASRVVAVDINPYAIACTQTNAELNGVAAKIETRAGDLFGSIEPNEEFDLILFNAPYLPVEQNEGRSWLEKAWAGGQDGRATIDRFIDGAPKHLAKGGTIWMVQSSLSDVERTLTRFSENQLTATAVESEKLDFEEIVLIEAKP